MFDDSNLVSKILKKSSAALIVQKVQDELNTEQQKREEFYNLIGEDDKAEFINGEMVFHSPVVKMHTDATKLLLNLLHNFVVKHSLGWVGVEKAMTRFTRNDYEPDICFFGQQKTAQLKDTQLLYPVPDFVAEVLSKSSKKNIERDTVTKYEDYEQHGVPEYWIVDPDEKSVKQYLLENGKYRLQLEASEGMIESRSVSGFNIPIAAIFDERANQEVLVGILTGGQ